MADGIPNRPPLFLPKGHYWAGMLTWDWILFVSQYFAVLSISLFWGSINLGLRNKELMIKQLHRLHLNYPEEVMSEVCGSEPAGDDAKAAKITRAALKEFKRDSARETLELSPGSAQIKQQVGWAGIRCLIV
jgi:hypothetical protein